IPTGHPKARDSWSNASVFGTPQEGGTGFAVERDAILRQLRERGVKNLVFLVADVHHAELIRHHPTPEWSFHEFVAGPLSATLGPPPSPRPWFGPRAAGRGGPPPPGRPPPPPRPPPVSRSSLMNNPG